MTEIILSLIPTPLANKNTKSIVEKFQIMRLTFEFCDHKALDFLICKIDKSGYFKILSLFTLFHQIPCFKLASCNYLCRIIIIKSQQTMKNFVVLFNFKFASEF